MRHRRIFLSVGLFAVTAAAIVACGDSDESADGGPDGSLPDTSVIPGKDSSPDSPNPVQDGAAIVREATLPFEGKPNGLFWENGGKAALYIADEDHDRIAKWTDKDGFTIAAQLPASDPDAGGLGQVVRLLDGTLVVTRFGFGTGGTVLYVDPTGDAGVAKGLAANRRRIGLAAAPDNAGYKDSFYVTYFTGGGGGVRVGSVATLRLFAGDGGTATESTIIDGLAKPVGVFAVPGAAPTTGSIFVTDQDKALFLRASRDGGGTLPADATVPDADPDASDSGDASDGGDAGDGGVKRFPITDTTNVPGADLFCPGPAGSYFVSSNTGTLYQVTATREVKAFKTGLAALRGCAYDGANRRLFVADVVPADAATGNVIHIFPVD